MDFTIQYGFCLGTDEICESINEIDRNKLHCFGQLMTIYETSFDGYTF